jgi:hypothetical protein
MIRDKQTIELMVNNYWKQVDIVDKVEITLEEYLERIGLTEEEIEFANTIRTDIGSEL